MASKNFIAIDLEAGQGRVCLASVNESAINTSLLHSFDIKPLNLPGGSYWDIYAIYSEVLKGLALAARKGIEIESIGITGWSDDLVAIAKDGSICGLPKASVKDPVPEKYVQKLYKKIPETQIYTRCGVKAGPQDSLCQLYAMRKRKSASLKVAKYLLYIPSTIAYMLSGEKFTEASIHSASGLMNTEKGRTDKELLSACKVKARRFPTIVQPGRKTGRLSDENSRLTGLQKTPIVTVAQYAPASAVVATPASNADFAAILCDDNAVVAVESDTLVNGPDNCRAADGRYLAYRKFTATETTGNFEIISNALAAAVDDLKGDSGRVVNTIHMMGRGASDRDLCQMTADKSGIPVVAGPSDPVITGNVIQQARVAGCFKSLADAREFIRRATVTALYTPK